MATKSQLKEWLCVYFPYLRISIMKYIKYYIILCLVLYTSSLILMLFSDDSVNHVEDITVVDMFVELSSRSFEDEFALNQFLKQQPEFNKLKETDLFSDSLDDLLDDNPLVEDYEFELTQTTKKYGNHETIFLDRQSYERDLDTVTLTVEHEILGKEKFKFYVWDKAYLYPSFAKIANMNANKDLMAFLVRPDMIE